jgi:hypothetical protein
MMPSVIGKREISCRRVSSKVKWGALAVPIPRAENGSPKGLSGTATPSHQPFLSFMLKCPINSQGGLNGLIQETTEATMKSATGVTLRSQPSAAEFGKSDSIMMTAHHTVGPAVARLPKPLEGLLSHDHDLVVGHITQPAAEALVAGTIRTLDLAVHLFVYTRMEVGMVSPK